MISPFRRSFRQPKRLKHQAGDLRHRDVGNVVEYGYPQEWIHELGKRIARIHIKEYAKSKRFSYPLGEGGEIDWKSVRQALIDVGYNGWITAEVGGGTVEEWKDVVKRMDQILPAA